MKGTLVLLISAYLALVHAVHRISSSNLATCMKDSKLSASRFDVTYFPENNTVYFTVDVESEISGKNVLTAEVWAYGKRVYTMEKDACTIGVDALCNLHTGSFTLDSSVNVGDSVKDAIPGIAYTMPDIDGNVVIRINSSETNTQIACVSAALTNSKTVRSVPVSWITAILAAVSLGVAAVASARGNANTSSYVATHACFLFAFFQTQALYGMVAVHLPPIVQSWTQNFQWSMGLIRLKFMQSVFEWYVQSTGGTPSLLLANSHLDSVVLRKRDLGDELSDSHSSFFYDTIINPSMQDQVSSTTKSLVKRALELTYSEKTTVLSGIKSAGYRAGLEMTSIFLTAYSWFLVALAAVAVLSLLFKLITDLLVKLNVIEKFRFAQFRGGWKFSLKGMLFRVIVLCLPQILTLALWELTMKDSAAVAFTAVLLIIVLVVVMAYAVFQVFKVARASKFTEADPSYGLYANTKALLRYGCLYTQYQARFYWFIILWILYTVLRSCLIAFGQGNSHSQPIGLLVVEFVYLVILCIFRPFMSRKFNVLAIVIQVFNCFSVIFILINTNLFDTPPVAAAVCGVLFFVMNAILALILLLMMLWSTMVAILWKNPESHYKPMKDNRAKFRNAPYFTGNDIKSSDLHDSQESSESIAQEKNPVVNVSSDPNLARDQNNSDFAYPQLMHHEDAQRRLFAPQRPQYQESRSFNYGGNASNDIPAFNDNQRPNSYQPRSQPASTNNNDPTRQQKHLLIDYDPSLSYYESDVPSNARNAPNNRQSPFSRDRDMYPNHGSPASFSSGNLPSQQVFRPPTLMHQGHSGSNLSLNSMNSMNSAGSRRPLPRGPRNQFSNF